MIAALLAAAAAVPTPAAQAYAAAVAPIGDCAAFAAAPALPDARPLLADLFAGPLPTPAPGEAADAFADRAVARLFARLGDPGRLVLVLPAGALPPQGGGAGPLPSTVEVTLAHADGPERRIGGARLATATELKAEIQFAAADQVPPPAAAKGLRILAMFEDWGAGAATRPADAGRAASQTSIRLVRLRARCAVAEEDGTPLPGWSYRQWGE